MKFWGPFLVLAVVALLSGVRQASCGRSSGGGSRGGSRGSSSGSRGGGGWFSSKSSSGHSSSSSSSYPKQSYGSSSSHGVTHTSSHGSSQSPGYGWASGSGSHSYPSSHGLSGSGSSNIYKNTYTPVSSNPSYPSYPSSTGLSGSGSSGIHKNTYTPVSSNPSYPSYPFSTGLSGSGSSGIHKNTYTPVSSNPSYPSYPSNTGLSGSGSSGIHKNTYIPVSTNPSYPSNTGLSGSLGSRYPNTHTDHSYPSSNTGFSGNSKPVTRPITPTRVHTTHSAPPTYSPYPQQFYGAGPSYGYGGSYGFGGAPAYSPGYHGPVYVPVYTHGAGSSRSSVDNLLTGLAVYNLARSGHSHHTYHHYYDQPSGDYYSPTRHHNTYASSASRPKSEQSDCTLTIPNPGGENTVAPIPCDMASSFDDKPIDNDPDFKSFQDKNALNCTISVTKQNKIELTIIPCELLTKKATEAQKAQGEKKLAVFLAPPLNVIPLRHAESPIGNDTTTEAPTVTTPVPLATYPSNDTTSAPAEMTTTTPPSPTTSAR